MGAWGVFDVLGVFTALIAVTLAYIKWTHQYWKKRNVPHLKPMLPFGNVANPFQRNKAIGTIMQDLYKQTKAEGWKYCGLYSMLTRSLMVLDLDLAKNVMTKDFNYFVDRGLYTNEKDDPLSCHLFAIGGKKWRNLRVKLTPTFTSGKLKAMFQTLTDCGLILEKYFEEQVKPNEAVDIKDVFGRFTTDIIGSCAFGLQCNTFEEPNSPFRVYGKRFFTSTKWDRVRAILGQNFPNFARAIGIPAVAPEISKFFIKIVEDAVNYREKNNYVRKDFLQLLIDIKNNKEGRESGHKGDGTTLTMDEVAAQCFVFFIAGFETSSTTATFALFELANNQDVQDKVRGEINTVLAKYNNKITYDSLNELKYMQQVIDEALRMYPPVPFVFRTCVEDYKIPGEDVVIEKGIRVFIPIKGFHYDESYWTNPTTFDPDRFTEENSKGRHQYAHIPFGEGPRICIGERFGLMQTKVGLTSILRKFRVTLSKKTEVPLVMSKRAFITTAENDIWLNFEKI